MAIIPAPTINHGAGSSDAGGTGFGGWGQNPTVLDEKEVSGVRFGKVAFGVEHEGVVGPGIGGLHLRKDGGELITGVNRLVEDVGEGTALLHRGQVDPFFRVNRGLTPYALGRQK